MNQKLFSFSQAIVSLCRGMETDAALELLKQSDETATVETNDMGATHIGYKIILYV